MLDFGGWSKHAPINLIAGTGTLPALVSRQAAPGSKNTVCCSCTAQVLPFCAITFTLHRLRDSDEVGDKGIEELSCSAPKLNYGFDLRSNPRSQAHAWENTVF